MIVFLEAKNEPMEPMARRGVHLAQFLRLSDGYALIPTFSSGSSSTVVSFPRSMAFHKRTALI